MLKHSQFQLVEIRERTIFYWIDALLLVFSLLGDLLLQTSLGTYLFIFYMVLRLCFSSIERNFALLMMLVPNLGVMYVIFADIYIPALNLLIGVALVKILLEFKKTSLSFSYFLLILFFIGYEWAHAGGYLFSSLPRLFSWTIAIVYVAFFLYYSKDRYSHTLVMKYFLAGLVVSVTIGVVEFYGKYGTLLSNNATIRFNGGAGDANYFSLYIMLGLFSMLLLIEKKRSILMKIIFPFLFLILFAFGILSLSRMFLLVVTTIILILLGRILIGLRENKRQLRFLVTISTIAGIVLIYFQEKVLSLIELLLSRFTDFLNDPSMLTSNRNVIAEEYFYYMNSSVDKTIFGIGIQDYHERSGIFLETHNILLELFVVWGVVGFFVFAVFLCALFKQASNKPIRETKLINWLPLLCMAVCYLSLNAMSNESFFLLLAFTLKHIFDL